MDGVVGGALNQLLKALFQRERPDFWPLIAETGYSFPSGHSMISVAFFGFIAYLLWRTWRSRYGWARLIPWAAGALVLSIGASRIYLGVHYPSDILAGYAVGGFWLAACIGALRYLRFYREA